MTSKPIVSALCMAIAQLLAAQQGQGEDPASKVVPPETLFAYRSSMNRADFTDSILEPPGIPGSLYGLSIIPFEVPVELIPVDPESLANATIGSTLIFRVAYGVIVKGKADVDADALIEAKVIKIREGKSRIRSGKEEPRVKEVLVGKSITLELENSTGGRARFGGFARSLIAWPPKALSMVTLLPVEYVLLGIACSRGCDL